MSFLHMSLIAGMAVVSIPVLLHLFGQRQPQLIDFPALKFVKQTTQEQSSSWQLRHFLLLLLRILLLALIALAMARPRVHSALLGSILGITGVICLATIASLAAAVAYATKRPRTITLASLLLALALWSAAAAWAYHSLTTGPSVPSSDQSAPVAAALIVDNGPTLGYRANNEMRLETSRSMALWVLDKLPIDSRVGVLSGAPVASLSLDPSTAKSQVKLIELRGARIDLIERIRSALDLVLATELQRKEIYVITDLSASGWTNTSDELKRLLSEHADEVLLQIIDVGDAGNANWRLGDAKPEFQTVPEGGEVSIEVAVHRPPDGARESATVELVQEKIDPKMPVWTSAGKLQTPEARVIDRQVVELSQQATATVQLRAKNLEAGTHNFIVRLDHSDPLVIDNERFVSVMAQSQRPTLVVADDSDIALYLQLSIDPQSKGAKGGAAMCEQVRYAQLGRVALEKFAVICLFDPPAMSVQQVQSLKEHVQGGGGLLTILGPAQGNAESLNQSPLSGLLPGRATGISRLEPNQRGCIFQTAALSHPVFHAFGQVSSTIPWNAFPVFAHWQFDQWVEGCQTLITYSDATGPAVIAHTIGRGQVITITTPIPEPANLQRPMWNELTAGADAWPAFFLLVGCVRVLSGADQARFNYMSGELVGLTNDPLLWPSRYALFLSNPPSRIVEANQGLLNLGSLEQPGIYRLKGANTPPALRAVSVNAPSVDTTLERLPDEALTECLGAGNYRLARNRNEIESSVGQVRFGRELYSLIMLFIGGLFLAEQATSNRFYQLTFGRAKAT